MLPAPDPRSDSTGYTPDWKTARPQRGDGGGGEGQRRYTSTHTHARFICSVVLREPPHGYPGQNDLDQHCVQVYKQTHAPLYLGERLNREYQVEKRCPWSESSL